MAPDPPVGAEPPLLDLFTRLRRDYDLPIGVDDYLLALDALRGGFGLGSRAALEATLATLWTTSPAEAGLLRRVLGEVLAEDTIRGAAPPTPPPVTPPPITPPPGPPAETSSPLATPTPASTPAPAGPPASAGVVLNVIQAARRDAADDLAPAHARYQAPNEYLPVTRRQMKQSWRHLRRPRREGPPVELDLDATVARIGREGVFRAPVLRPRRRDHAALVLLIDQDGSMVPFHALSRQLLATAARGWRLGGPGAYYFHDYPEGYLYRDPARLDGVRLLTALAALGERTPVLIVGDAGAARGRLDPERIAGTARFLTALRRAVRHVSWLNPLPNARWPGTSAAGIASLVPMFELSRAGLDAALAVLRGRYQPPETLYPWMR